MTYRHQNAVDRHSAAFLDLIHHDPTLRTIPGPDPITAAPCNIQEALSNRVVRRIQTGGIKTNPGGAGDQVPILLRQFVPQDALVAGKLVPQQAHGVQLLKSWPKR